MERSYLGKMSKKILIINGSPRANGNTESIIDSFVSGAEEKGHSVTKFNIRQMNIRHCVGCYGCQTGKGHPCVQSDDMQQIYDKWADADVIVFASPIYWMHFTSLFATVRDRLFAATALNSKQKEAVLIATAASPVKDIYHMPAEYYEYMVEVLKYKDAGRIIAGGVQNVGDVQHTQYLEEAYKLGKTL